MNVNPGELNKRIQIFRRAPALDKDGYEPVTEELFHQCAAKFSRTSGTELVKAQADFGEVKCRFLIRHTKKPIHRRMFVRYAGEDYEIVYVNDYEDRHEYTELWCERSTREDG